MKIPTSRKLMFIGSLILSVLGLATHNDVISGVGIICLVILSVTEDILNAIHKLSKND